jgi:hypothetical protein
LISCFIESLPRKSFGGIARPLNAGWRGTATYWLPFRFA